MEAATSAVAFLASPDVLSNTVKHLSRHEAERLKFACKAVYSTFQQCCFQYRPRLLVVASEANRLVEIDPSSGALMNSVPIRKPGKRASTSQWWPTVISLCPYDQNFYVCQYMGRSIRRFNGRTLAYMRIAAVLPAHACSPEGLCFSKGCMFVASADAGFVYRCRWDAAAREFDTADAESLVAPIKVATADGTIIKHDCVPWTMITGPDGNLYIAADVEYDLLSEHHRTVGAIFQAKVDEEGKFCDLIRQYSGLEGGRLRRPSGLSFDSDGNLFVTSMTNQVIVFSGPFSKAPGQVLRVTVAWADPMPQGLGALHPWDCCWSPGIPGIGSGPLLFVTRHTGVRGACKSRVSVYCAATGACLHEIFCPQFKQANMMAFA